MNSGSCSQMTSSWKWPIERRSVTSRYHGRKISGWRRQQERQKSNRFILTTQQLCTCVTLLYISLPSLHDCDNHMKLPYFTRPLYGVGDHNTKNVLFRNIDTVLLDLTSESSPIFDKKLKLSNIGEVWNSATFGLLSSRKIATMPAWRNDFSFLLRGLLQVLKRDSPELHEPRLFLNCFSVRCSQPVQTATSPSDASKLVLWWWFSCGVLTAPIQHKRGSNLF